MSHEIAKVSVILNADNSKLPKKTPALCEIHKKSDVCLQCSQTHTGAGGYLNQSVLTLTYYSESNLTTVKHPIHISISPTFPTLTHSIQQIHFCDTHFYRSNCAQLSSVYLKKCQKSTFKHVHVLIIFYKMFSWIVKQLL